MNQMQVIRFLPIIFSSCAVIALAGALRGSGSCIRNDDCSVNAWCNDDTYIAWCASQGAHGSCPSPQCVQDGQGSSTLSASTAVPMATTMAPTTVAPSTTALTG